jgi:TRAP-type uncharacterized transport system substrate-binding protein
MTLATSPCRRSRPIRSRAPSSRPALVTRPCLEANQYYADKLTLVKATASAFSSRPRAFDGKPLYTSADIPSGTYNKIQSGFFSSSVETVSWEAGVYVNTDRLNDDKMLSEFIRAVTRARAEIIATYGK